MSGDKHRSAARGSTGAAWWCILGVSALVFFAAWVPLDLQSPQRWVKSWWNGSTQAEFEHRVATSNLLARWAVPVRNHMDLRLFQRINLDGHFLGREETVFATVDVRSYQGLDALPMEALREQVRKAVVVRDSLQCRGISVIFLLAPGKVGFMPERLPATIRRAAPGTTNYERFATAFDSLELAHVDLLRWFQEMKGSAPYPLYPRYGSHWSYYGESLALDSVVRYVERSLPQPLPHLTWSDVVQDNTARVRDGDVTAKAGVWRLSHQDTLAYPEIQFTSSDGTAPVPGMVIGDSYARGFVTMGVMEAVFSSGPYWYYYNSREPGDRSTPEFWELDLEQEIERYKVILLLANPANLTSLGNGFIDDAYALYTDKEAHLAARRTQHVFRSARKAIRNDAAMMRTLHARSRSESVPLDSLVDQEARARASEE